ERVRSLEQYTRENNLEISGVPEIPNEDTICLLKDTAKTIGVEVDVTHLSSAHRIPSFNKRRPPPTIVQFQQRIIKEIQRNTKPKCQASKPRISSPTGIHQ
ncbi:hypothetical protein J6590_078171, partial [Homalodisca vitripennis]